MRWNLSCLRITTKNLPNTFIVQEVSILNDFSCCFSNNLLLGKMNERPNHKRLHSISFVDNGLCFACLHQPFASTNRFIPTKQHIPKRNRYFSVRLRLPPCSGWLASNIPHDRSSFARSLANVRCSGTGWVLNM